MLQKISTLFYIVLATTSAVTASEKNQKFEAKVQQIMATHQLPGLAVGHIKGGELIYSNTFGYREVETETPLDENTVMYGASLTKFMFATYVMQLAEEGKIDIDVSIAQQLPKPLPAYERFADLHGDERWKQLTLRVLLSHFTGFPNYRFFPPTGGFDPNGKLEFLFDPGFRYGYSGEGYYIAQLVIEEALKMDTREEFKRRFFAPLGMARTDLIWQDRFRPNFAQGYTVDGVNEGHNMQSNARAAGSMDTTLSDYSSWVAAYIRGDLMKAESRAVQLQATLPITSRHQFPPWDTTPGTAHETAGLGAGVGVKVFKGPKGPGFFHGGHNEKTDNLLLCLVETEECVIFLMNTAKGHLVFPQLVEALLGQTGMPWSWHFSGQVD
ncbi:MAG: beta-lactamase family protein [Kordiimonadaceae bacterium]|nr:beta-lactamase family protein [Kordiimonadaceae bacterium]MBO6567220.1 beta-lactamase family protein [Kordiimonadaceae bacterium]MBO6963565.1 beta-lactamase family protein [Kordiimonadaceae bacterium]